MTLLPTARRRLLALALLVVCLPTAAFPAVAQDFAVGALERTVRGADPERPRAAESAPAYYVTERGVTIRSAPSISAPILETLRLREGVRVLDPAPDGDAAWHLVQFGGLRGYVRSEALSNVWLRVSKSTRTVYLYRGATLVRELPADVAASPEDKVRRSGRGELDHYRMPEGTFFITRFHPRSQYYRAFVLSYPGPEHARRGLAQGIITEAQYDAIVRADAEGFEPPMGTPLGGLIEIHGQGSGRREAWTRGCVALRNVHMDELWDIVRVGTPVVIEP